MNTEVVQLKDIKRYDNNARVNAQTVEQLAKAITKYGYKVPIQIDADNMIVAGDARYQALLSLGWTEALCVRLDIGTDKVKEYRIVDNKIHDLSDWDTDILDVEMRGITEAIDMFPCLAGSLKEETMGSISLSHVTDGEVVAASNTLDTEFDNKGHEKNDVLVKVKCHACTKEFFLNRKELKE